MSDAAAITLALTVGFVVLFLMDPAVALWAATGAVTVLVVAR